MEWSYIIIAVLFVVGVVLAFPLAIGICAALGALMIGLDRFTARCPGFSHLRRGNQRRLYRPGQIVTQFLAPDVRRDVEVVDASRLNDGLLTVRTRTWNVLYAIRGLSPEPPFGKVRTVTVDDLWGWSVEPWGGAVPEGEDGEHPDTSSNRGGRSD